MTRRSPLPAGDVVGLLAAMIESPLLADLVPREAFPPHSAARELRDVLDAHYIHIWSRAHAFGDPDTRAAFAQALVERLHTLDLWQTRDFTVRVIDAVTAVPALIDSGRARLTKYAAGSGRLVDDVAPAPAELESHDPWLDEPLEGRRVA